MPEPLHGPGEAAVQTAPHDPRRADPAGAGGLADPARLAALHAACFRHPRPWSAAEIADLLAGPGVFLLAEPAGFVMGRTILDEVELLTIAVDPAARRQGIGARLLAGFATHAREGGAVLAHLEVAADNAAAQALYLGAGWRQAGRRRGYYRTPEGGAVDALLMTCMLAPERP